MANTILLKRSGTAANVPTAGELSQGELAINTADERLFSKNTSNVVFEITDHDNLTNFVADEHVAHSGVSISAGDGMTGGGTIAATRTLTLGTPTSLDATTTNAVTATSHTHAVTGFIRDNAADTFSGTLTASGANIDMADNTILQAKMDDYSILNTSVTPTGTTQTITYSTSQSYEVSLASTTGNITITISGGPPAGTYGEMIVKVTQHGTTARTITWAGGTFEWPGGTAPTMTATASAVDIFHFSTWNSGTNWWGSAIQDVK